MVQYSFRSGEMFDWKSATTDECAWHIARTSAQRTTAALAYYERTKNEGMLTKITEARKMARRYRVLVNAERITEDILKEGLNSADYSSKSAKALDQ